MHSLNDLSGRQPVKTVDLVKTSKCQWSTQNAETRCKQKSKAIKAGSAAFGNGVQLFNWNLYAALRNDLRQISIKEIW